MTAGTDAARGHQQPPVTQPNNRTTTRNVGTEAARGHQQTAGQQDMMKDGSGLVARSQLTAEDKEDPMETSEDNGSDSTYHGSTDSMKVH